MDWSALIWGATITLSIFTICVTKIELERIRNRKGKK